MDLSLRAMRYVRAAMRLGNISAAADEMNVAASAVSAALDQAETAFGMALVTRARAKGISPTSSGRVVLRRIEDLLERYESMLADGVDLRSSLSGMLKIGYYAPIAPAFLPRIVAPLMTANPGLTLSFEECDNTQVQLGLLDGSFDVIVFVADLPAAQIVVEPLIHAPSYCLCSDQHPFAAQRTVELEKLAVEPLIILDRPVAKTHYLELLESSGRRFNVVATANSTEMVRSLVGVGLGCALLNMRPATSVSYGGSGTACIPITGLTSGLTLSLGHVPGPRRRAVQAFSDACQIYFASSDGSAHVVSDAGAAQ
ncbi:LysR substrate-binding domain-containing protein [Mesorhizobium sp. 131-2-1]|uniref:LysR substrate-binding domain-containing protein n=1 Tax=Mesorhizobium sp. 131-2-1 TaxID=2744518 RepID=UPI0018ED11BB|nr:LysR substrate-binding domain-containing protein [Mesorhizobium sp. 131-2-1]BCG97834.1 LysR family transcriptional regulator [Mesorhizobium sp. 131-2-1]